MDIKEAMHRTEALIDKGAYPITTPGLTRAHLHDMVTQVVSWDLSDPKAERKAHRWLGWLQCAIVFGGGATLDQVKLINKES